MPCLYTIFHISIFHVFVLLHLYKRMATLWQKLNRVKTATIILLKYNMTIGTLSVHSNKKKQPDLITGKVIQGLFCVVYKLSWFLFGFPSTIPNHAVYSVDT